MSDYTWRGAKFGSYDNSRKCIVDLIKFDWVPTTFQSATATEQFAISVTDPKIAIVFGTLSSMEGVSTEFVGVYLEISDLSGARHYRVIPMVCLSSTLIEDSRAINGYLTSNRMLQATFPGRDPWCVQQARVALANAMDAAAVALAECVAAAGERFAVDQAVCTATALIPFIGWGTAATCTVYLLNQLASEMKACAATYSAAVTAARVAFLAALAACPLVPPPPVGPVGPGGNP